MSTRCNIHFNHGRTICANIYRHSDGYPGEVVNGEQVEYGVLGDILKFFRELKENVRDTRLGDAEYLAAKFLVWQAKELAREYKGWDEKTKKAVYEPSHYMEFLGVSPCRRDHGDIEYIYEVDCDKFDDEGFPIIRWKAVTPFGSQKGRFKAVKVGAPKGTKAA